jgi:hypothetical protein
MINNIQMYLNLIMVYNYVNYDSKIIIFILKLYVFFHSNKKIRKMIVSLIIFEQQQSRNSKKIEIF